VEAALVGEAMAKANDFFNLRLEQSPRRQQLLGDRDRLAT
jgi:hypothetical protein